MSIAERYMSKEVEQEKRSKKSSKRSGAAGQAKGAEQLNKKSRITNRTRGA
jgi:hypothetical protein